VFPNDGSGGFRFKSPKKKSYFWKVVLFILGIVLIALIYLFRDIIWEIFFPKNKVEKPTKTESKVVEPEVVQTEVIPKTPFKLLPEWKVIKRYDIADEATWDKDFINAKFSEGKAVFVKNKGWLIYG
jgi:quinol-cytochrome oxidoreductase complex cytochrome b subunit